jgi:hypothetical protein
MNINWTKLLKRSIYWGIILLFIWFVVEHFSDIEDFIDAFKEADYKWVVAAFGLQFIGLFINSFITRSIMHKVGYNSISLWKNFEYYLAVFFVNLANPLASVGGTFYYARLFSKKGVKKLGGAVVGIWLSLVFYSFSILVWLMVALYLMFNNQIGLRYFAALAIALYVIQFMILLIMIFLGGKRPLWLKKLVYFILRFKDKLGKIKLVSMLATNENVDKNLHEFSISSQIVLSKESRFATTLLSYLGVHLFQILAAIAVFVAFDMDITFAGVIIFYGLFFLFSAISPTPQGVGIVEGIVQVVLTSAALGYSSGETLAAVLVYRGVALWVPVFVGFLLFKKINLLDGRYPDKEVEVVPKEDII